MPAVPDLKISVMSPISSFSLVGVLARRVLIAPSGTGPWGPICSEPARIRVHKRRRSWTRSERDGSIKRAIVLFSYAVQCRPGLSCLPVPNARLNYPADFSSLGSLPASGRTSSLRLSRGRSISGLSISPELKSEEAEPIVEYRLPLRSIEAVFESRSAGTCLHALRAAVSRCRLGYGTFGLIVASYMLEKPGSAACRYTRPSSSLWNSLQRKEG